MSQPTPAASTSQRIWSWLKWPFALGLIGWLIFANRDQFKEVVQTEVRWELLGAALACSSIAVLIQFFRWYLLVKAQGFEFRFADSMRLGFLGLLLNFVTPGAIGGDLVKAGFLAREQDSRRAVAIATILLDRILGFIAIFAVGAIATLIVSTEFDHRGKLVAVLWAGTSAGVVGLIVMLHPSTPRSRWLSWFTRIPKIGGIVQDLADGIALYQTKRRVIVFCVAIGLVVHLLIISAFFACGHAVGAARDVPDFSTQMLLLPMAQVVSVFVPLPGGVGVLEGAVQESYKLVGAPGSLGLLAACAYRVTSLVVALFGAVYYASARRQFKQQSAPKADDLASEPN